MPRAINIQSDLRSFIWDLNRKLSEEDPDHVLNWAIKKLQVLERTKLQHAKYRERRLQA